MKTERRHELQQNSLAEWLTEQIEWCKQNAAMLTGVIGGVALVVGGYSYFKNRSEEIALEGWSQFFNAAGRQDTVALETLSVRDAAAAPGQMAELLLADTSLANGIELMSTDRPQGEGHLNVAKNRYDKIRRNASDPVLKQRAALGIARCYESTAQLEPAISEYEKLLKDYPEGPYAEQVRRKIEYLKAPSTQAFVNWYREHKPLPPQTGGSSAISTPGDLKKLPDDEKSFPAKP